jgi:hypothetical protein
MRGGEVRSGSLFSYVDLEALVIAVEHRFGSGAQPYPPY